MLVPLCTVVHSEVLENEGWRLPGTNPYMTLRSPDTITLLNTEVRLVQCRLRCIGRCFEYLQGIDNEDRAYGSLLLRSQLEFGDYLDRQQDDQNVDKSLDDASHEPEDDIINAVSRVS